MSFYVYILASKRNGTLYVGMTDDLVRRVWLHKEGSIPGFTKQHNVKLLVVLAPRLRGDERNYRQALNRTFDYLAVTS